MAIDAIRGYIQLASGLTELSRAKATEAAHAVLMLPAAVTSAPMVSQVTALADELLAAATTNRANLLALVRSEVENAVERTGLVPAADLDRARAGLARLSADIDELREQILGSAAVRSVTETGVAAIGALTGQVVRGSAHDLGTDGLQVRAPAGSDKTASAPRTTAPGKAGPARKAGAAGPAKRGSANATSAKRAASAKKTAVTTTASVTKSAQKSAASRRKSAAAPVTKAATPSRTSAAATKTAAATGRSGTPTKRGAARKSASTAPVAASPETSSPQKTTETE